MSYITFTSDFGTYDGYVGIVKGVILSINRNTQIIDLTHDIEPFNTSSAAWIIYNAYDHFPSGTVHLVVIDPGVGTSRRGVVLRQKDAIFVGPDNGVFSLILSDPLSKRQTRDKLQAFELDPKSKFYASIISSTFHARDIYGRVAAQLSLGVSINDMSKPIDLGSLKSNSDAHAVQDGNVVRGNIAHIDRFGNLITTIPTSKVSADSVCFVMDKGIGALQTTYRSVREGELVALKGSHGFVEIAVCEGRADQALDVKIGTDVEVRPKAD